MYIKKREKAYANQCTWVRLLQRLFARVLELHAVALLPCFPVDMLALRRLMRSCSPWCSSQATPRPRFNIPSQHSCPLSRVHPREDECAVTMLVENTLYKHWTGHIQFTCSFCLFWPLWKAVHQHHFTWVQFLSSFLAFMYFYFLVFFYISPSIVVWWMKS